jgi:hypothetical protein
MRSEVRNGEVGGRRIEILIAIIKKRAYNNILIAKRKVFVKIKRRESFGKCGNQTS